MSAEFDESLEDENLTVEEGLSDPTSSTLAPGLIEGGELADRVSCAGNRWSVDVVRKQPPVSQKGSFDDPPHETIIERPTFSGDDARCRFAHYRQNTEPEVGTNPSDIWGDSVERRELNNDGGSASYRKYVVPRRLLFFDWRLFTVAGDHITCSVLVFTIAVTKMFVKK